MASDVFKPGGLSGAGFGLLDQRASAVSGHPAHPSQSLIFVSDLGLFCGNSSSSASCNPRAVISGVTTVERIVSTLSRSLSREHFRSISSVLFLRLDEHEPRTPPKLSADTSVLLRLRAKKPARLSNSVWEASESHALTCLNDLCFGF